MPGGWPPDERERDACARVLLHCNGDFSRIIDAPALDATAYAEHVARILYLQSPDALPLFFITGRLASPEALMVLHSRVIERARVFDQAQWVVCVAPGRISDFIRDASTWAAIEPVGKGLCTWQKGPRPMLIASWEATADEIAAALTLLGTVPESGFIATVEREPTGEAFDAEGAVIGLESLTRMRAAQEEAHERSGARGKVGVRPNPRLRRNG